MQADLSPLNRTFQGSTHFVNKNNQVSVFNLVDATDTFNKALFKETYFGKSPHYFITTHILKIKTFIQSAA